MDRSIEKRSGRASIVLRMLLLDGQATGSVVVIPATALLVELLASAYGGIVHGHFST